MEVCLSKEAIFLYLLGHLVLGGAVFWKGFFNWEMDNSVVRKESRENWAAGISWLGISISFYFFFPFIEIEYKNYMKKATVHSCKDEAENRNAQQSQNSKVKDPNSISYIEHMY